MSQRSLSHLVLVLSALVLGLVSSSATASAQRGPLHTPTLRIGLEGGFGGEWGEPRGAAAGVFGQLGVQLSPLVGLYYQPSLYVHAIGDDSPNTFLATGHLAMLDFSLGLLQFGAGAGVDVGRYADCDSNECSDGPRETDPAVGGRLALVPHFHGPRARIGIPIAAHIHSAFLDSDHRLTSILITVGVQRF